MFDLLETDKKGRHIADELEVGDICWVAKYLEPDKSKRRKNEDPAVVFSKYCFTGKREKIPDEQSGGGWILDGKLELNQTLNKSEAAKHPVFGDFFDRLGRFKQVSALRR